MESSCPAPDESQEDAGRADRSLVINSGLRATAIWSLRFLVVGVAAAAILWLLTRIWVGVFPVILAIISSAVLWPLTAWVRRRGLPAGLAAGLAVLAALIVVAGVVALLVRPVVAQSIELATSAGAGLEQVQRWLSGPPLDLGNQRIDEAVAAFGDRLRDSAGQIAAGVFTGVSAVATAAVTSLLVLVLTFLFLKDGPTFLPWLQRQTGRRVGRHLTELLARMWETLGGFVRVQAIVSFIDAALIGLGLLILGVPLAGALTVFTFIACFVPIAGAFIAGGLAVLVALVSNGLTTALLVLAVVVVVQQLESNVLAPIITGRSLQLHAAVVLLSVTVGTALFGITGAFLAVPTTAILATALRYLSEQISSRTG